MTTTFDVDGEVGWIRGASDDVPDAWQIGFGPLDVARPATVNMSNQSKNGEDWNTPLSTAGNGYHAPFQGTWHVVIAGNLGSVVGTSNLPWTQRPEWSPCGNLDNTFWGGSTVETWWRVTIPAVPIDVTYLRVTVPVVGQYGQCGGFMGFGGVAVPNPEVIGKHIQMRWALQPPTSWEYGLAMGAATLGASGVSVPLQGTLAVAPGAPSQVIYVGLTLLQDEFAAFDSVYCGIASFFCDYSIGFGGSWKAYWGAFTWEWVVASGPTVYVGTPANVDVDELPILPFDEDPAIEVRTVTDLRHDGGDPDPGWDDEHVALLTPIEGMSLVDGRTDISLTDPTVLDSTAVSWKFRLTHTFMDRAMYARNIAYYAHDYSYDPATEVEFLTHEQSITGWYILEQMEQEYATATGGFGGGVWEVRCIGWGQAVLKVEDFESAPFLVYPDRWYGLTASGESGNGTFILADILTGDTLASISGYATTLGVAGRVMTGGRGLIFEPDFAIGFDEIALEEVFTVPSVESYVTPEPDLGWNIEYCKVESGQFSLEGQPAAGSMNVYSLENGLLAYPDEWVEANDTGNDYLCMTNDYIVTVVYLITEEFLENRLTSARPTEVETQQRQLINYLP